MEWIGTSGSFGMVVRPLKLLSTFKQRSPPLEVDRKAGIPFPTKEGNGPSSQDEEGKMVLFLSCGGSLCDPLDWRWVCRLNS